TRGNLSGMHRVYFYDMNQDGLADILEPYSLFVGNQLVTNVRVYINKNNTWVPDTAWYNNQAQLDITNCNCQNPALIFDMNGDGSPDILNTSTSGTQVRSIANFNNTHVPVDLLSSITLSSGGQVSALYKPSTQYVDGSGNLLNPSLPLVIETVSQITVNDGLGNTATTNYSYSGGSYYFNPGRILDRKFAGFATITKTDPAGNTTKTFYHQGNSSDSAHGEYSDEYWKIGKPYRVEVVNSSSSIYAKAINKWDSDDLGNGRKFVKLAQTLTSTYDGDSTHRDAAESYTYDNTYGNLIQKVQNGEVTSSDDGTFTDIGADK